MQQTNMCAIGRWKGVICLCRCLGIGQEVGELFQEILMRPEQHCNLQ